ncbi:MAG TPA: restriction endonuclease subunit S, partial [Candidatus Paceibacterota bacterium]|nr:restriction endonuclease subunit S [Candidatus Paceibacterota bacterium]
MNRLEHPELAQPLRRFKPYPAYKESGVEWLGTIPAHWGVARASELTSIKNGYPFDAEYFVREEGIPLVRIRDLSSTEPEVNYIGPVVEEAWINPGDVIVGMDGDFNVARWSGRRALLNQRLCCLTPRSGVDARFIAYSLPAPLQIINDLTHSTTVKHLSSHDVRKVRLVAPPMREQAAIAAFLDRKTTNIDNLMARKQQLIDLLRSKRDTLITDGVTRGLEARASLAHTDSPSFPRIPVDWELRKLRRLLKRVISPVKVNPDTEYREIGIRSWGKGI